MKRLCFYITMGICSIATQLEAQSLCLEKTKPATYAKPWIALGGKRYFYPINDPGHNTEPKALQSDLYTKQLGFFCKQELKLEQQVKIPVKIRLGSTEYTNWLEGKAGCGMPVK